MRILELGKFYPPERGGMETLLQIWAEGFQQRGHQVTCIVANRSRRTETISHPNLTIHRLASLGSLFSTSLCPAYTSATQRHPSDVIHAHFPNPLADVAVLRAPPNVPVVVHWHSDIVRQKALMGLYQPIQSALLRRANRIVVATPQHLEFSAWLAPFKEKVDVIPFGLDLGRYQPTPALLTEAARLRSESKAGCVFLNIGRLVGYKGQRYAVEALRDVPDAELWLVGTGPLEAELRSIAANVGVADRIRFWGNVPDNQLPALLHACDVFLFPSVTPNEAFGLVLVEAMACAKPLLACHLRSGVTYVCRSGDNGVLVPPYDAPALAQAMGALAASRSIRNDLGHRGRLRARREFSHDVMLDQHLKLFKTLMGNKRQSRSSHA